jgi:PAS domain S-box-containing protein
MSTTLMSSGTQWARQISALAIVELDTDGIVRAFNLGAERIKGWRADEIIGRHFSVFYREEDRAGGRPQVLLDAARRDGFVEDTGWRVRADGTAFWAHVSINAIHDRDGRHGGFVNILRDLSADKRDTDRWDTFLRTFAHDLISPVTALIGYLDLLQETTDLPPELLQRAVDASEHISEMARSLSQRVRHRDQVVREPVRLSELAREAAALVLPGDLHGRLHFSIDDDPTVVVDPMALRRSVANIVENAAKYSDDRIDIRVEATESAVLTVIDSGRGIHPDDLDRVTHDGYRGRLADPDDGGSGLGLTSARDLIRQQGGAIVVDSEPGRGTTVRVELPLADAPPVLPAPTTSVDVVIAA